MVCLVVIVAVNGTAIGMNERRGFSQYRPCYRRSLLVVLGAFRVTGVEELGVGVILPQLRLRFIRY